MMDGRQWTTCKQSRQGVCVREMMMTLWTSRINSARLDLVRLLQTNLDSLVWVSRRGRLDLRSLACRLCRGWGLRSLSLQLLCPSL